MSRAFDIIVLFTLILLPFHIMEDKIFANKNRLTMSACFCPYDHSRVIRSGAGGRTLRSSHSRLALRASRLRAFAAPPRKTIRRIVFISRLRVRLNKRPKGCTQDCVHPFGAGGRTRTDTVSLPTDFESVTSANSITPAQRNILAYAGNHCKRELAVFIRVFPGGNLKPFVVYTQKRSICGN